jgi:hypothetical protein
VRRKPYSVVLLDEVEKAHADVFNVLLQVGGDLEGAHTWGSLGASPGALECWPCLSRTSTHPPPPHARPPPPP